MHLRNHRVQDIQPRDTSARTRPADTGRRRRLIRTRRCLRTNPIPDRSPNLHPSPSTGNRPSHSPIPKADKDNGLRTSRYRATRCRASQTRVRHCRPNHSDRCHDRRTQSRPSGPSIRLRRERRRRNRRKRVRRLPCRHDHRHLFAPTKALSEAQGTRPHCKATVAWAYYGPPPR